MKSKQLTEVKLEKAKHATVKAVTEAELLKTENAVLQELLDKVLTNQKASNKRDLINLACWVICFMVLLYDKLFT